MIYSRPSCAFSCSNWCAQWSAGSPPNPAAKVASNAAGPAATARAKGRSKEEMNVREIRQVLPVRNRVHLDLHFFSAVYVVDGKTPQMGSPDPR